MKILIDTEWFAAIQDLAPNKQKEVMNALLNYPNGNSDTNLWKKTILPNLEKGRIAYYNKILNLKQNNPQKTNKKITGSDIGSVSVSASDTTIREYIYKENKENSNKENSNKGGVGEKEKREKPTLEEVLEYAKMQNTIAGMGGFPCTNEQAEDFFNHYAAQGWIAGNGIPIHNWQHKLREWVKEKYKITTPKLRMSLKEIKDMENHIKLQKMLDGEL